jgi:hypothetical protein
MYRHLRNSFSPLESKHVINYKSSVYHGIFFHCPDAAFFTLRQEKKWQRLQLDLLINERTCS